MVAPDSPHRPNLRATCQQRRARSDPLPTTLRATWTTRAPTRHHNMHWASENGEQQDQSAASRAPHRACPDSPHWQTQARYLPATTRALIHFKQFARDLDHPRTHAPPLCVGPVTTENSPTSPQASRAPHHACPDSPHWQTQARYLQARTRAFGSTSSNFARNLDHPRAHAPPLCVGPVTTESSTTRPQAFRAPHHACPDSLYWQTHARYLPATTRAFGSTSSKLRATWTTRAPTRHHYALGQ